MSRVYSRDPKIPDVDLLDWQLIVDIEAVFGKYAVPGTDLSFTAFDARGKYDADDFEAFRAEVESQPQSPERIWISLRGTLDDDPHLHLVVYLSEQEFHRGCSLSSEREEVVDHVAARLADLFALAHERKDRREAEARWQSEEQASVPGDGQAVRPTQLTRRNRARLFYHPWVVGIGASIVAAGVIALVASLLH
jgi:hypothetical protein